MLPMSDERRWEAHRQDLARRLFNARYHAGWTIRQLADKSGVGMGTIQRVEGAAHVRVTLVRVLALATALDVDPAWLLHGLPSRDGYVKIVI